MAKNPPNPPKRTPPATTEKTPAPAANPEPSRAKSEAENNRLTIPLDKDGRPDFASMRDKTRERVKKLVSDPAVARELGISDAPAVATLPPFVTGALLTAINQLEVILIARVTKAPAAIVAPIALYTPEERAAIEPALDNVVNKYGGAIVGKWGDEVALVVLLSTITMRKIDAVRAAMPTRPPATVVQHPSSVPAPAPAPAAPDEPPTIDPEIIQ